MHGSKKESGDANLEKRVRKLFCAFGYDKSKELDIGVVPSKLPSIEMEL